MNAVLTASGLCKSWGGVRAVDDVSFAIAPGEVLALIGPNGAGKSTTFSMIGGQLRPDRGDIRLGARDVTGARPRVLCRLGVGRTFQVTETFGSMTLRENVQTALLAHRRQIWRFWRGMATRAADAADGLLAQVGLDRQAGEAAGRLAYGDLKRLELAMALSNEPRLLLMDEPTAGTALAERTALMALVRRLASEQGLAVLFTEHDMDVVFGAADRILVLNRGRLVAEGDAAAIRADPLVQAIYLGGGRASAG
ncbi:MAG: ABC transporter ATP-binding protein [Acetobacteraceae bacterium]|nr:ABC transporter ATP-binding protein [Acetobacteraceae bacterium]